MPEPPKPNALPLIEERAKLTKEARLTGRVRVSTRTETVEEVVPVELGRAEVNVVRVPVGRTIDAAPEVRIEGDLTIIPVVEERVVVTRELYLLEEIHVRRVHRIETESIPVTLRRQTAKIKRSSPGMGMTQVQSNTRMTMMSYDNETCMIGGATSLSALFEALLH